jgi:hypothetical protein
MPTVNIGDVKKEPHFLACVLRRDELTYAGHQLVLVYSAIAVMVESQKEPLRVEVLWTEACCAQTIV